MKRSQIILFALFIVLTAGIYITLKSNQKDQPKSIKKEDKIVNIPVKKVKNEAHAMNLVSYGQVSPNRELMIAFKIQGKLKHGEMVLKPGVKFSTGQILYELDNLDVFYTLAARKATLSNMIISALPDIELDFSSEEGKWKKFLSSIGPGSEMPSLPAMSTREKMFMMSRNIVQEYYNVVSMEVRMGEYLYAAPFSGTVLEVYSEPGSIVNPGVQIAKIARTGEYEVKVPISMEDLETYREKSTASFLDPSGKRVGTGKIIRVSDVVNQQTQSADVYYSIKAIDGEKIYNGMFLNVSIDKEATKKSIVLPRTAIKDGKVNRLIGNKIESVSVTVVGAIPDSVYVTGISDDSQIVIDRLGSIDKDAIYKGINR